jgi:hypothetical protein
MLFRRRSSPTAGKADFGGALGKKNNGIGDTLHRQQYRHAWVNSLPNSHRRSALPPADSPIPRTPPCGDDGTWAVTHQISWRLHEGRETSCTAEVVDMRSVRLKNLTRELKDRLTTLFTCPELAFPI